MYWYGGNDTMNQIIIHEPYTDIEIRFGLEDISINIYKFAKDFLKENYDIDFRIHFEIVDNIPDGTGITAGSFVTKQTMYNDKVLSQEEYQEICNYEALNKAREYALNLFSKSQYTEKDIYERLTIKKKLNKDDANKVIAYLKEHNFINDKSSK